MKHSNNGFFYFGREEQALFLIRVAQLGYIALIVWGWTLFVDLPCRPTEKGSFYCTTLLLFYFVYAGSPLLVLPLLSTYTVEQFIQKTLRARAISREEWEREMDSVDVNRLLDEKMPRHWLERGVSEQELSSFCYHICRTAAVKNLKKEYGFAKEG